jgi:hypothetical protein
LTARTETLLTPYVVDEFVDIYNQERQLKTRRIHLAFPHGIS